MGADLHQTFRWGAVTLLRQRHQTSAPQHDNREEIHKELGRLVGNRKVTLCQPRCHGLPRLLLNSLSIAERPSNKSKILTQDVDRQNTQTVGFGHPTDKTLRLSALDILTDKTLRLSALDI